PLEFVCLLGAYGNPASPGTNNDVTYGWINGNDVIAEVAVSRLSCNDVNTAGLALARCRGYQATPWLAQRDWFRKCGVAAMAVNGWTEGVRYTAKYVAEAARRAGMNPVWGWFNGDNNQQGFIDQWLSDHANMVFARGNSNTQSFPQQSTFPMYITAGGGHTEGQWEGMWRIGSLQNLQGPSVISGTRHAPETMPCNVILGAMGRGVIVDHMAVGWARAFAISMLAYDNVGGRGPNGYATEFSMYGDPAQIAWLGEPFNIDVTYPEQISPGTSRIDIDVELGGGNDPAVNALVTLIQPGELVTWGFTDAEGHCVLQLPDGWEGNWTLTVTGDNLIPFQHQIVSSQNVLHVGARISVINDDEGGNGDGVLNPGETVLLTFEAENFSRNQAVEDARGRIIAHSPFVEIEDEVAIFARIDGGQTAEAEQTFELFLSPSAPAGAELGLVFALTSGASEWRTNLELPVVGPAVQLQSLVNGNIYEAQMSQLNVVLINRGSQRSPRLTVQLISLSQWVQVVDGLSSVAGLNPNRSDRLDDGPFVINPNTLAVPGTKADMQILLRVNDNDVPDTLNFQIQISRPRANTPLGPDPYGYVCYDNTDQNWEQAPDYRWIEICPRERDVEIEGTPLPANRQQDFIYEIRLPFTFVYYGQNFGTISVCENGFIAAGNGLGELRQFENYPLDQCINGSFGMIAPYWDEMTVTNNNTQNVYTAFDEENHVFIVQFYNALVNGNRLDFEIVLYDPEFHRTLSGDSKILFQYKTVPNPQGGGTPSYFSVGLNSPRGDGGLNYCANNQYPVNAAPIAAQRALMFVASSECDRGRLLGRVTDAANGAPIPEALVYNSYGQIAITNQDGVWDMPGAWALDFGITAHKQGYNDSTLTDLVLEMDEEQEINFVLLHPEFRPSHQSRSAALDVDDRLDLNFSVTNTGNGPLTWRTEKQLRGDANAEPWEFRRTVPIGQITSDARIGGVVFIDDSFYVSGGADSLHNLIYVLNRDNEIVRTFEQFGMTSYGHY
ncbi:MAG: hypothetical protein V2A61_06870, partial [Calditrichota bacterium]